MIWFDTEIGSSYLTLDFIITPWETIQTEQSYGKPSGIYFELLSPEDFKRMPILAQLKNLKKSLCSSFTL